MRTHHAKIIAHIVGIWPHNPTIVKLRVGLGVIVGAPLILVVDFFSFEQNWDFTVSFGPTRETFSSRIGILHYTSIFLSFFFFFWLIL